MFLILRKIRRELLLQDRFGRYLFYAIGEIVLVVIGILIAVQIDGWNSAKEDRIKELSYLTSYAADLRANINELDRVAQKSESMYRSADDLIATLEQGAVEKPSDIDQELVGLLAYTRYLSKEGTTENLLGAGSLELIQNLDIRASFVTQRGDQKRMREVEQGVYGLFNDLVEYVKKNTDLYRFSMGKSMIDGEALTRLSTDRYFLNTLDDMSYRLKDLQRHYSERRDALSELLVIVEREIAAPE